ncbi:MAG: PIG-L family deacetylase [Planctomycetota bacterium]
MRVVVTESPSDLAEQAASLLQATALRQGGLWVTASSGPLETQILDTWAERIDARTREAVRLDRVPSAGGTATSSDGWKDDPGDMSAPRVSLLGIGPSGELGSLSIGDRFHPPAEAGGAGCPAASCLGSDSLIAVASGAEAAEAVARALEGDVDESCPASFVQLHPDAMIVLDESAASRLSGRSLRRDAGDIEVIDASKYRDLSFVVLSPHPDDTSVSCGGLVDQIADHNRVVSFLMCSGHHADIPGTSTAEERRQIRLKEAEAEAKRLRAGVVSLDLGFYDHRYAYLGEDARRLTEMLLEYRADIVLAPSERDRHPAHAITRVLAQEAMKRYVRDHRGDQGAELWGFEGPWGLFDRLDFNVVVPVSAENHEVKLAALREHRSQIERLPYDEVATQFSQYRALLVPELRLTTYGRKGQSIGSHVELFRRETLRWA